MIQTIITSSGNVKGWLVENYYIPKRVLKYFTPVANLRGTRVISKVDKSGIKIRGKRYYNILTVMDSTNCSDILRSFIINGISLHEIIFFPCKLKEVDTNLSSFWKLIQELPLGKCYPYRILTSEFKEVGYILLRQDLYTKHINYINMLEIKERNKGIGTKVVTQLKQNCYKIGGLATCDSLDFWKKQGAEIVDNQNHFTVQGGHLI